MLKTLLLLSTILYVTYQPIKHNQEILEQREDCIIEVEMQYDDQPELMRELIIECNEEFKLGQ